MSSQNSKPKSAAAGPAAGMPGAAAPRRFGAGGLALAALLGVASGAAASYFAASAQFAERANAIMQADELRVQAANDRVAQLQDQLRDVETQAARQQQQTVADADAQQSRVVRQLSEQQHALEVQQHAIVEQARQHEYDLAKPDLPLRVWVHKPLVGRGLIASVHNFGTKDISLTLTVHRAAAPQSESWNTVIAANANQVIGADPGLQFRPGDSIDLASADYRPMSFQVPQRAKPPPN